MQKLLVATGELVNVQVHVLEALSVLENLIGGL